MNDEQPQTSQEDRPSSNRKTLITTIVLVALAVLLLIFAFSYFQLFKVNTDLANKVTGVQTSVEQDHTDLTSMQKTVTTIQETEKRTQELSQQQEQLMAQWRAAQNGDLNKWHIAEAQYLVKLANDHLRFTQNVPIAIVMLQRASQELASVKGDAANQLKEAVDQDIMRLQNLTQVDTNTIYSQLNEIDKQLDQLPLPTSPLQPTDTKAPAQNPNLTWYQSGWERTKDALSKIVIVRNIGNNALPLVLPEEKVFLYQNLHSKMDEAIWGLLHHNNAVYQTSLARAQEWIKLYFVQEADLTKSLLQKLTELSKINVAPDLPDLSATLTLFESNTATPALAPSSQPAETPPVETTPSNTEQ